ncbi:MAG: hypothetical protein WD431_17905 [Cyclobacteriaceae bacterium]
MKKCLVILFFLIISLRGYGQDGEDYLNIGVDAGLTLNEFYQVQFPAGFGASIKGLYGVGLNGQVSLTGNYMYFPIDQSFVLPTGENLTFHVIPVFLGYRLNFDEFFLEPQIGGAMLVNRFKNEPDVFNESTSVFAFAAEAGYVFDTVEVSFRYQHAGASPNHLGLLGIRAAYKIPLGYK